MLLTLVGRGLVERSTLRGFAFLTRAEMVHHLLRFREFGAGVARVEVLHDNRTGVGVFGGRDEETVIVGSQFASYV